jgi:acetyl-CoA carboxylase carboxyltransferase component
MSEKTDRGGLGEAREAALAGGPARHHDKTAEQGKLPVRERVGMLLDAGSFSEEAQLANWDVEGLGADGVVTGLGTIGGRRIGARRPSRRSSGSRSGR